jgi:4-cresol dehydrogenase (hydroxylating) flavoprotein subunit
MSVLSLIGDDVTGHCMSSNAVHRPLSTQDVQALVLNARTKRTKLYPISTGHNWGYGSASPVLAGCEIVDLSGMNHILNKESISVDQPVARIQPGVTQGQLYRFLQEHHPDLTLNVTGSSLNTSILGNALERGVGYLGPRTRDIFGLEVVLGTGELLFTGGNPSSPESTQGFAEPEGLGPSLDGLFIQSNFGIVVSACFRLVVRRPIQVAVTFGLRHQEKLPTLVDRLRDMTREGLLPHVTHLGNRERALATMRPRLHAEMKALVKPERLMSETLNADRWMGRLAKGSWTGVSTIHGNQGQVAASMKEIKARLSGLADVDYWTPRKLSYAIGCTGALRMIPPLRYVHAALLASKPIIELAFGIPSDAPVLSLLSNSGHSISAESSPDLDKSPIGLLYVSPMLPHQGAIAVDAIQQLQAVAAAHGFELPITLNFVPDGPTLAITNLVFDRQSRTSVETAHACAKEMERVLEGLGLELYRARADMLRTASFYRSPRWQQIERLRGAFDPDGVIAPGRYSIHRTD